MIAIIGAMQSEINNIAAVLQNRQDINLHNFIFYKGTIYKIDVVVTQCGIGKVNAAATTALLLSNFNVDGIINIGVAGGVSKLLKKLDIVIAEKSIQYDFDLSAFGLNIGQLSKNHLGYFTSNYNITKALFESAKKVSNYSVYMGTIISGDKFVADTNESQRLAKAFNALACDMETAAIAQVAQLFNVPFCAVRSISDGASDGAGQEFDDFETLAAENSIKVIKDFLSNY